MLRLPLPLVKWRHYVCMSFLLRIFKHSYGVVSQFQQGQNSSIKISGSTATHLQFKLWYSSKDFDFVLIKWEPGGELITWLCSDRIWLIRIHRENSQTSFFSSCILFCLFRVNAPKQRKANCILISNRYFLCIPATNSTGWQCHFQDKWALEMHFS